MGGIFNKYSCIGIDFFLLDIGSRGGVLSSSDVKCKKYRIGFYIDDCVEV